MFNVMNFANKYEMDTYKAIAEKLNLKSLSAADLWKTYDEAMKENSKLADLWENEGNEDYSSKLWYDRENAYNAVVACELELETRGL